jgi:hypothetical protein
VPNVQQGPKKISGGYDSDDVAFLDDRQASNLVAQEQARRLLDTMSGPTVIGSSVIAAFTFVQSR